jgi:hypothetical protein
MAMTPNDGLLVMSSTPHRKSGVMFNRWRDIWGKDDTNEIIWRAASTTMNPTLDAEFIAAELADDPARNRAEYLCEWREDLSDFVPADCVANCTEWTVRERPYDKNNKYVAYTDASGGTGNDSFTLAIAYKDRDGKAVLACTRERHPRFIPSQVVAEYAELIRSYGCRNAVSGALVLAHGKPKGECRVGYFGYPGMPIEWQHQQPRRREVVFNNITQKEANEMLRTGEMVRVQPPFPVPPGRYVRR